MTNIRNILAVVNPNRAGSSAAQRGAALAKKFDAHLTLLSVVYESAANFDLFHMVSSDHVTKQLGTDAHENMEAIAKTLGLPDEQLTLETQWGHPFDQHVNKTVEAIHADLVCLSPRDENAAKLSHAEWRLIHRTPVPLLLAKNRAWSEPATVVASVDVGAVDRNDTGIDEQILHWATTLSDQFGKLEVFHATHVVPDAIGIAQSPDEYVKDLREHRKSLILSMLATSPADAPAIHIQADNPDTAIAEFCESRPADLLVMGVFARSRLADFLIGSTARKLLPRLPCDVLAIPTAPGG